MQPQPAIAPVARNAAPRRRFVGHHLLRGHQRAREGHAATACALHLADEPTNKIAAMLLRKGGKLDVGVQVRFRVLENWHRVTRSYHV